MAPAPYAGGTGGTGVCGGATGGGGGGGSIGATAAADLAVTSTFHPGSGGGGAGGNNQRCSYGGAGGGGGGGALRIVSPLAITVGVTGQLLANGGNGGSTPTADGSGGGGGGSGGVILLESPSLTVAGAVRAAGGAGGSSNVGCGADGGVGGLGRIRLSTGSTCTLSGTFNPPLASGCAAGGTSGQANVTRTLGTTCRPSLSVLACDPPETCNGTSNVCPTNVVTRVPTPETCNGVDDNCDGVVDNITATACSPGACATGHQACSGTSVVCVVDSYSPNGTLCRASVNACDPAETCTGSSTNCPTNVSAPAGFSDCSGVCLPTGTACTVGAGNCAASGTMTCGVSGPINVSVGYLFSCGLNRDGSVRCWGYNGNGESGNASYTAYQVTPNTVGGGLANVTEIEGGHHHTCARVNGGTVRCWGYNGYGQLGDGTLNSTAIPTTVSGLTNVTRISSGIWHSCAMRGDGSVWCWGYGGNGQLGNGTYPGNQTTPVRVSGISNAVDISCGGYHCCAALADGTANCWGWNGYGQLGNGAPGADLATPTTVVGLTGVTKVSASYWNSCAIVAGGAVRCWGYGANGELGNGAYSSIYTPVGVVGVSGATLIDSGYHHTCVRLSDSTSRCWGYNGHGQLGNGTFTSSPVPVSQGLGGVIEVTSSVYHTCAALTDGTVRCWGFNDYYQLGNGTTGNQPSPVNVNAFSAGTTCSATAGAPGAQACTGDGNCNGVVGDITPDNCQYNECVGGALYCSGASTACTYGYYYGYGTACTSLSGGICNGGGSCVCPSGTAYCTGACRAVQTYYYDNDLDGYGTPYSTTTGCPGAPPFHYVTNNTDCNDSAFAVKPGATETCNGLDDNCNGSIDEGNPGGGASCSTGNVCIAGAMTCVGGSLSCQVSGYNNGTACTPAGSPATVTYIRGTSPLPWIDACTNGARTNYSLGDDGATGSVGIGFGFNYYGTTYTTVGINSNGWLSFPSASSGLWSNYALPYSGISNGIFAFWDDLYPYSGTVCTVTVGSAPNRRFITQWNNYSFLGDPSSALTFQISLTESTNTIDVLYQSMYSSTSGRASGGSATIGIQNGTGPTVDHVSTNTPWSVGPSGSRPSLRWSPTTSGTPTGVCASGTCVGSGVLRFTLGWAHPSDFDLHVVTPCGSHIYFGSLTPGGSCGGTQDHDDTVGIGPENTFWTSAATTGSYTVCVVPWSQRYGGYNAFSVGAYVSNTLTGGYRNGSYYYSDSTTDCSRYSAYYVGTFYYNGTSSSYWYW
ncbi:MAG: hypothetical protein IPN17_31265 [Deltaproteobacteria bacterium]|nr:hypothetical protein [Deltaproteobacteria bacterium]